MLWGNLAESITEFLFIDHEPRRDKPLPAALEVFGPAAHVEVRGSILPGLTGEEGLHSACPGSLEPLVLTPCTWVLTFYLPLKN